MAYQSSEYNNTQFLKNLRSVNQKANVDPDIVDLIEAYSRLKLNSNQEFQFYPERTDQYQLELNEVLKKNTHLDPKVLYFLQSYFNAVEGRGLVCLLSLKHLAHVLDVSVNHLNRLASDNVRHYTTFDIKKNNGNKRKIFAPKSYLKIVQRKILDNILEKVKINSHAEGFRKRRSILTNAQRHIGKTMVIKMDLKDFFPSITFKRISGLFKALGYPNEVAMTLTKLVTHQGVLPTGAPTSPVISNILSTKLDKRLSLLGKKKDFDYSRYADDMTFSSNNTDLKMLIPFLKKIINDEGFEVNESKTRILRNSGRQKIAGIVVNEKINIEKKEIKKIRAILHNCRNKDMEIEIKKWAEKEKGLKNFQMCLAEQFKSSMCGKLNYIKMVNPKAGQTLLDQFYALEATT
ncbi:MAG: retron St85 family RNA-directed DNA polymerase [Pseudomonadota bacterium]